MSIFVAYVYFLNAECSKMLNPVSTTILLPVSFYLRIEDECGHFSLESFPLGSLWDIGCCGSWWELLSDFCNRGLPMLWPVLSLYVTVWATFFVIRFQGCMDFDIVSVFWNINGKVGTTSMKVTSCRHLSSISTEEQSARWECSSEEKENPGRPDNGGVTSRCAWVWGTGSASLFTRFRKMHNTYTVCGACLVSKLC